MHFEEWVYNSYFTARNLRIEARYVERYALEVSGGFFDGWKGRVKLQVRAVLFSCDAFNGCACTVVPS